MSQVLLRTGELVDEDTALSVMGTLEGLAARHPKALRAALSACLDPASQMDREQGAILHSRRLLTHWDYADGSYLFSDDTRQVILAALESDDEGGVTLNLDPYAPDDQQPE